MIERKRRLQDDNDNVGGNDDFEFFYLSYFYVTSL